MMPLSILSNLTASLAALIVMAGLVAPSAAQEPQKLRLIFPTSVETFILPYLVPHDQGWYEQRGLQVEETFVSGAATAIRAVLSGSADLTIVGPPALFNAIIEGARLKSIGSWQPVADYKIVMAKSAGASLADLAGRVFASAGPADLTTEVPKMVMRKNGVDTAGVRFVQVGGHPARLQAIAAGKAQASLLNTITALRGERDGIVNIVADVTKELPLLGYVLLVAREADLANPARRKAIETFLEGNILGARHVVAKPAESVALLLKRVPDLDPALVRAVVDELNAAKAWGVDGGNDAEVIRFTTKMSVELGVNSREVKLEEVVDSSLAEAILARLGKF